MIKLIVARSRNKAIGKDNKIIWKKPEDMNFFKSVTTCGIVVMGSKTFESMNRKPLPNRINIVITSNPDKYLEHDSSSLFFFDNIDMALFRMLEIQRETTKDIYIIGGTTIYKEFLDRKIVDLIYLTEIDEYHEGDTFFDFDFDLDFVTYENENRELGNNCIVKHYISKKFGGISEEKVEGYPLITGYDKYSSKPIF